MAPPENRRRKKDHSRQSEASPWGSMTQRKAPIGEVSADDDAYGEGAEGENGPLTWRKVWHMINIWSIIASLLFLLFIGGLSMLVVKMWTPQDLRSIPGYTDKGIARDLTVALRNANGGEIIFTEGEINRYLRDTCRLKQTGIFSLIVPTQAVAVRMRNGYVELIIDRALSTHFHQTTAVHLTFSQELQHGKPKLHVDLRGGEPILGSLPRGGQIGSLGVPPRYMQMLLPALETMRDCYPDIWEIIETAGYKPEFHQGDDGAEGYVRLIPYSPTSS